MSGARVSGAAREKTMRAITTCAILGLFASACGLGDDPLDPNPIDPREPPAKRDVDPIPGGGTSGGPIRDALTVFVLDAKGQPIQGVLVQADLPRASGRLKTDGDGRVDFNGGQFSELLALHAIDDAYQFSSLYGVNASVVTFQLNPVDSLSMLEASTLTGTVSGWSMLPENTETRARVANVFAIGDAVVDLPQSPRPGTVTPGNPDGTDSNLLVDGDEPFPSWLSYSLKTDRRARALAVLAGSFDLESEPQVSYTHLGIREVRMDGMDGMDGMEEMDERIEGQDIEISHALDQKLEVILSESPELANQATHYGIRLDEIGTIPLPSGAAPLLTDRLAEASYHTAVHFWSDETVLDAPRAEVLAEQSGLLTSFTYTSLLQPLAEPSSAGMSLAVQPTAGATMHVFTLTDASEKVLWSAVRFGDIDGVIELPEIDQARLRVLDARLLTVTAVDLGDIDLNNTRFETLDAQIRSLARSRAEVWF